MKKKILADLVKENSKHFEKKIRQKFISKIVDCAGKKRKLTFTNFQIKNIEIIE